MVHVVHRDPRVNSISSNNNYSESESEFDSDPFDSGLHVDQNDSESDYLSDSDTDSEPKEPENDTEPTIFDLDSQITDNRDEAFSTDDIEDVDDPNFTEPTGPTHDLPPDARPLQYSLRLFPVALLQVLLDNKNMYAVQSDTQGWTDTTIDEMKPYLCLQIICIGHLTGL